MEEGTMATNVVGLAMPQYPAMHRRQQVYVVAFIDIQTKKLYRKKSSKY